MSQGSAKTTALEFLNAYAHRDIDACMQCFADRKSILVFGTNLDEVFKTPDEVRSSLQRDFSNMSNIQWGAVSHMTVEESENLASVLIEMPVAFLANAEQEKTVLRYAMTLIKQAQNWRIVSAMASVPAAAGSYNFSSWE